MTIMEIAIALNNDYTVTSNMIGKVELFAEASYTDYKINLKEIALKIIKESGTEDDFNFLATEAAYEYVDRAKKSIEKIIESVKKFVKECKDKVVSLFNSVTTRKTIDKIDKACKANPKIRNIKVQYQDTDRQISAIQRGIDAVQKRISKIKSGASTTISKELDKIDDDTKKNIAKIAVVGTITLAGAIVLYKRCSHSTDSDFKDDDVDSGVLKFVGSAANSAKNFTAEKASELVKATGVLGRLKKEKAAKNVAKRISLISGMRKAINAAAGKVKSKNLETATESSFELEDLKMFEIIQESAYDDSDNYDSVLTEGLDLDMYYNELCNNVFSESTSTNYDWDDDDYMTESYTDDYSDTYMEQMERELFGDGEYYVSERTMSDDFLKQMEDLLR